MKIEIATLFPEMCRAVLAESILGRAQKKGIVTVGVHNIRDYTLDKHRRVDDAPYGGGMGMLLQAEPVYRCYEAVCKQLQEKPYVIYLSPQGQTFTQKKALSLSQKNQTLFLLCGHYEGIDERVLNEIVDEEISIGDYVLTGGELPALVLTDAIVRLCDGVLSSSECFEEESHFAGLLEYPQYTRPEIWHEKAVPDVLLSGHHENIAAWRKKMALLCTKRKRPDLLKQRNLDPDDEKK